MKSSHLATENLVADNETGCGVNLSRVALVCRGHLANRRVSEQLGRSDSGGQVAGDLGESRKHGRRQNGGNKDFQD